MVFYLKSAKMRFREAILADFRRIAFDDEERTAKRKAWPKTNGAAGYFGGEKLTAKSWAQKILTAKI